MTDTVIRVENLGKKYVIGHQKQERYLTLRDAIAQTTRSLGRNLLPTRHKEKQSTQEEFWALKDVSFEIKQGDRVGIIGRNGAGKSTLLKILSRITEPTTGRISIKGRVASLLEVGTGFHPELTGRENIYLNGAILGMGKNEINKKFDEIVTFAEVERFLDTPVKRYSSGMYVRLAFAVAAHLETEVLLVDEVLAVGDFQFQKKCIGKMEEVGKSGKTLLFVSHNMGVIESLCDQSIGLSQGQIFCFESTQKVLEEYLHKTYKSNHSLGVLYRKSKINPEIFQITEVLLIDERGELKTGVKTWDYLRIRVKYYAPKKISNGSVIIEIKTVTGNKLIQYSTRPLHAFDMTLNLGEGCIDCIIPCFSLSAGEYKLGAGLAIPMTEWLCWEDNIDHLEVYERDVYQSNCPPHQERTIIAMAHCWEVI